MAKLADLNLPPCARRKFSFKRKTITDGEEVECHVLIQILTPKEFDVVRASALHFAKKMLAEADAEAKEGKSSSTFEELLFDARIYETLMYALRDPDPKYEKLTEIPPWATSMELRAILTTIEVGILWRAYCLHEQWLGPVVHELTDEEFEAMVIFSAANEHIDPEELYGAKLRAKTHHRMANLIVDLRGQIEELKSVEAVNDPDEIIVDDVG